MLELLPFIFVLWLLTSHFGIVGAACAWLLRAAVDLLVLEVMRRRLFVAALGLGGWRLAALPCLAGLAAALAVAGLGVPAQLLGCLVLSVTLWLIVLTGPDRQALAALVGKQRQRVWRDNK